MSKRAAADDELEDAQRQLIKCEKRVRLAEENQMLLIVAEGAAEAQSESSFAMGGGGGLTGPTEAELMFIEVTTTYFEKKLDPRVGQLDLISAAMSGDSCVLAVPPSAGKTIAMVCSGLAAGIVAARRRQAQTGSDVEVQKKDTRCVCPIVAPTLELVHQISERINAALGAGTAIHTHPGARRRQNGTVEPQGDDQGPAEDAPTAAIKTLVLTHAPGSVEDLLLQPESRVRFVVCTPERCTSAGFVQCLATLQTRGLLGPMYVDEGHLVEQWGQTFRGSYLRLKGAIATAFQGGIFSSGERQDPQVMVVSGSVNNKQAWRAADLLGLPPSRTSVCLHPLDRKEINVAVLDLNDVVGSRQDVLREGAKRMAGGCLAATLAIVFVATSSDANFVASVLNQFHVLTAVPFYSRLDEEAAGVAAGGREGALALWRSSNGVGVLVATVLAAHGLDEPKVDFTGHLDQRGNARQLSQEFGRACRLQCRTTQPSRGNWLARNPMLMSSAAYLVDFSDGDAASAHREMVGLVESGPRECRRAHLLRLLGSPLKGVCSGCDGCHLELSPYPGAKYELVDATKGAIALLEEVERTEVNGKKTWFVQLLRYGEWRAKCSSHAEANALFLRLYVDGVLNLGTEAPSALHPEARALYVRISLEKGAKIKNSAANVHVWCLASTGSPTRSDAE